MVRERLKKKALRPCEMRAEREKKRKKKWHYAFWLSFVGLEEKIFRCNQSAHHDFEPTLFPIHWPLLPLGKVIHIPRELIVCKQHKNYLN